MSENCENLNLCAVLASLDIAVNRVFFINQLNTLFNDLKDSAAIVTLLEKGHFYEKPENLQKAILMAFMNTTPTSFDRQTVLLKASSAKRANSKKNNTIAAQHLWQTGWAIPLLSKTWDILTPSEQSDVQDLSDAGSIPFQYLKAFYFFKDKAINSETLDINTRIQKLADLNTDAGHDLWRVIQWHLLYTNQLPANEATEEWTEFFIAIALNKLPISQSLAFRPIHESQDSATWPTDYKTTLYSMTSTPEEAPFIDVLKVLAEEIKTADIADLYLKQFLSESTARNPENNAERMAEIERMSEIVPDAKQIIADAICQFDKPPFATEILLDLGLDTPEKRLQKLRELSDQGLEKASAYLATAYADSLFEETPLVIHLGIPSRNSLAPEECTFGNLAQIHKENTIQLIRLGLKGNRLAQHFLMTKPENQGSSILEKLFDNRSALSGQNDLGASPCSIHQYNMNRELTNALIFAFSVVTILRAPNDVPDFFYEQIQQKLSA